MTAPHSVAAIIGDLRRLGVRDGDLIMVHASLHPGRPGLRRPGRGVPDPAGHPGRRPRAATGTVGAAGSELIDAADLVAYGARWMTDRFAARRP